MKFRQITAFIFLSILIPVNFISCYEGKNTEATEEKNFLEWYDEGVAFSKKARYEEAIYCFDKTIELGPAQTRIKAWRDKGNILYGFAEYEKAIYCYDRVLELEPSYGIIRQKREEAKRQLQNLKKEIIR